MLDSVTDETYTLEDSMQAHEINDAKIDSKHDIKHEDTISYWLKNNKIRMPDTLSIN